MRISDWSSDVCSSDLSKRPCATTHCSGAIAAPPWSSDSTPGCRAEPACRASVSEGLHRYRAYCTLLPHKVHHTRAIPPIRGADTARLSEGHQGARSEEHTSELQSLMRSSYAVFCLKKNKITAQPTCTQATHIPRIETYKHN